MLNPEIETIMNPITGDRMTVLHSSYQRQDQSVEIRFDLPPVLKEVPCITTPQWMNDSQYAVDVWKWKSGQKAIDASCKPVRAYKYPQECPIVFAILPVIGLLSPLKTALLKDLSNSCGDFFKLLINSLSWIAQQFKVETSLLKYWSETDRKLP